MRYPVGTVPVIPPPLQPVQGDADNKTAEGKNPAFLPGCNFQAMSHGVITGTSAIGYNKKCSYRENGSGGTPVPDRILPAPQNSIPEQKISPAPVRYRT